MGSNWSSVCCKKRNKQEIDDGEWMEPIVPSSATANSNSKATASSNNNAETVEHKQQQQQQQQQQQHVTQRRPTRWDRIKASIVATNRQPPAAMMRWNDVMNRLPSLNLQDLEGMDDDQLVDDVNNSDFGKTSMGSMFSEDSVLRELKGRGFHDHNEEQLRTRTMSAISMDKPLLEEVDDDDDDDDDGQSDKIDESLSPEVTPENSQRGEEDRLPTDDKVTDIGHVLC